MIIKDYTKAVVALCGNEGWSVKREDGVCEVIWDDDYEGTKPTHAQITAKAEELKVSTTYIDQRKTAYPSIQDQLDMQYWDSVNGTTTWKDAIAKVKADNPKPE